MKSGGEAWAGGRLCVQGTPVFYSLYDSGDLTVPCRGDGIKPVCHTVYGTGKEPGRSIGFF